MKKQLLAMLIWLPLVSYCQSESLPGIEPYFSAIIVQDLDTSTNWFVDVLGFKILDKTESIERGFRQANLKAGNTLLELIELNAALSLEDIAPDYNSKTRIRGYFKVGFIVSDFDRWISHLKQAKANFHGDVITDNISGKRMVIIKDPDGNRIQVFEK